MGIVKIREEMVEMENRKIIEKKSVKLEVGL